MTDAQNQYLIDLATVSNALALWAQDMIVNQGWSIGDCNSHLRQAAKVAGRK